MSNDYAEKRTITVGRVTLTLGKVYDYEPDTSWLGKFCNFTEPWSKEQKLVHRESGLVMDHHGIWQDRRGHIQPTPEDDAGSHYYNHEYQYILCDNGHEKIAYALADAKRGESRPSTRLGSAAQAV